MKKERPTRPGYGRILDAWVPPDDAGEPVGCVATTFTFAPAFFEEECLARFVGLETDAAENRPEYLVEREEKLAQLRWAAALVDQHYARGVRSLRWDLLSARVRPGILHAKVSLLLWGGCARLIVASANLTADGYRRNQEVFAALDYFDGSESPLPVLREVAAFLRQAVRQAVPPAGEAGPAVARWDDFLGHVEATTRRWGSDEPPRSLSKPRVFPILSGPKRPSVFEALEDLAKDHVPTRAYVVSPFFDPPGAANEPARQVWGLLRRRGPVSVEYHLTGEDVPEEDTVLLHAPESLVTARPDDRKDVELGIRLLRLEDGRPLHAKCLWLEGDRLVVYMMGSSNFTSAGLGLGAVRNIEANLAFVVGQQPGEPRNALDSAWPPVEEIPEGTARKWQPRDDADEDSPPADFVPLPDTFADARFGSDAEGDYLTFTVTGEPPAGWSLSPDETDEPFASEDAWRQLGRPHEFRLRWLRTRPPSGFRVRWDGSGGSAWWPVNVIDGTALPPPDELRGLPLEVLVEILTSARPLHVALAGWLKRRGQESSGAVVLDPHKRVDTSAFLLQRTRRVSWALEGLRERLEKPVYSEQSLTWRLRGPVGVLALARAIDKEAQEARSEAERCFLLTEMCVALHRVRPAEGPGSLSKVRVRKALRELVLEIRSAIPPETLAADPAMGDYARRVFEEILP
jgi:hypothetical protein